MHVAFKAGEMMDLEPLDLLGDAGERRDHHRHRDQGAQFGGNTVAQFDRRHEGRANAARHGGVDQSDRGIERGNGTEQEQRRQPHRADRARKREDRHQQDSSGDDQNDRAVPLNADGPAEALRPVANWHLIADGRLKGRTPGGKQIITRIGAPLVSCVRGRHGRARGSHGGFRNLAFRHWRTARQIFNRGAVKIARRKIHREIQRAGGERFMDQAHLLEQFEPVDLRDQSHTRDYVADRNGCADLPVVDAARRVVYRCRRFSKALVEPSQRRRDALVLVLKPMHELHSEVVGYRRAQAFGEHRSGGFGLAIVETQKAIGEGVSLPAFDLALTDAHGEAAEIFDQHDPQRDRKRPQFADGERLNLLIRSHEPPQQVGIEAAVGVRYIGPCNTEYPRVANKRARNELGQLPIVARRQVDPNLADLPLD